MIDSSRILRLSRDFWRMYSPTTVISFRQSHSHELTKAGIDQHRQLTIDCGLPDQLIRHLSDETSKLNLTILASLLNLTTDYAPAQAHLSELIPRLIHILDIAYLDRFSEFSDKILDFAFDTLSNLLLTTPTLPESTHEPLITLLDRYLTSPRRPEFVQQFSVILQEAALKSPALKREFVDRHGLPGRALDFLEEYEAEKEEDEADVAMIKSILIKIIVDLPNEDSLLPLLLPSTSSTRLHNASGSQLIYTPGEKDENVVVERMVSWLSSPKEGRADLIICAAHYLAALARNGEFFIPLVVSPFVLCRRLTSDVTVR